jgi:hypothetical protein
VRRNSADQTKLAASASTAYGAVKARTRSPPTPGPPINAAERVTSSLELPSIRRLRPTSEGRNAWYETSKKTVSDPAMKPTTNSCSKVR